MMLEQGRTGAMPVYVILLVIGMAVAVITGHRVHGARAEAPHHPVSQATSRQPDVSGREVASAAEAQRRLASSRRSLPPRCLLLPTTAAQFAGPNAPEWLRTMTALLGSDQPLHLSALRGRHHLLLVLLHLDHLQSRGHRRQSARNMAGSSPAIVPASAQRNTSTTSLPA